MAKYPILYEKTATDFFAMGQGPITNLTKATVVQERNGLFVLEGEMLIDSAIYPLVTEDKIIKCDADIRLKDQRFRIKRIVPKSDGKAQIYAEHVSYAAQGFPLQPDVTVTGNAQSALAQWQAAILVPNSFEVISDIGTTGTTHWRVDKVKNARQALGGVAGSILDVWGGEYEFDNYTVRLLAKRGKVSPTILAYGRNIIDLEQERNITNTATSVLPYAVIDEKLYTMEGYFVDSGYADKYPARVVIPIDFSSEFDEKKLPTSGRLKSFAEQYIKSNEVGIPTTSIKLSFLDLSKTLDYQEIAPLEELALCDEVPVYYEKLGINTRAKVVRTVWNVLTESYDEIEVGAKRTNLTTIINNQGNAISNLENQTNNALWTANNRNKVFFGLFGTGQPKASRVGDMWYKPNGKETEFYIWNRTVWQFIMSTVSFEDLKKEVENTIAEMQKQKDALEGLINTEIAKVDQSVKAATVDWNIKMQAIKDDLQSQLIKLPDSLINTAWIDKLYGSSAFITDFNAQSVTAIEANINSIITKKLDANIITSAHLKADNALIDKLFATEALVDRLVSKTAFINSIKAIEISASKITSGTLDAANINVINLNASNITSGVLRAIKLVGENFSLDLPTGTLESTQRWSDGSVIASCTLKDGIFTAKGAQLNRTEYTANGAVFYGYDGSKTAQVNSSGLRSYRKNVTTNEYAGFDIAGGDELYVPKIEVKGEITGSTASFSVLSGGRLGGGELVVRYGIEAKDGDFWNNLAVGNKISTGYIDVKYSKNAIHPTRDGIRATPAYETAESYLGDIGRGHTDENCAVWVPIETIFSDTINTDIPYEVFLQVYDDAHVWVADFRSDQFLVRSDKPMIRFAWEIKAKRIGFEHERLVKRDYDNEKIQKMYREDTSNAS